MVRRLWPWQELEGIQPISWGEEMPAGVQLFSFHSVQVPRLSDRVAPLHLNQSGNYPTDEPGVVL